MLYIDWRSVLSGYCAIIRSIKTVSSIAVSLPMEMVTSDAVTLTVMENLVITSQPTNQSVVEGDNAVFKVTAKGYNLSYQWQSRKSAAYKWGQILGATSSSLTIQGTVNTSGQEYRCVIMDGSGNQVISDIVTLTVN